MDKQEIIEAIKKGVSVFHNTTKQVVKVNCEGVLYSHNYRNGMPYELTNSDLTECFTGDL